MPTDQTNKYMIITVIIVIILIALGVYISSANNTLTSSNTISSTRNNMMNSGNKISNMMDMDRGMMMQMDSVSDDKSFIEYVIPHHQEAIDASNTILANTQDPELKAFLNSVISTQGSEIAQMKTWYKAWFNQDYAYKGGYTKMMNLTGKNGLQVEKVYVQGMLSHHSGVIEVAQKVMADNRYQYKSEILELSSKIIKTQTADNITLQNWLNNKYKNV